MAPPHSIRRVPTLRLAAVALALSLAAALAAAAVGAHHPLDYRDRGDRFEGINPDPVGGYDVLLLGAMLEPPSPSGAPLPETLTVRFYLDRREEVWLQVRERHPDEYYWLDRVRPTSPWRAGAVNEFHWPSREVVRPLDLHPSDLLVLVRLGRESPGARERVAPATFSTAAADGAIEGYRFSFRLQGPARVRHTVYGPGDEPLALPSAYEGRSAAVPFDLSWRPAGAPEGEYRLVLEGYFVDDNVPFRQVVEFFHSPSWPG